MLELYPTGAVAMAHLHAYEHVWKRIEPELGHLFIEAVDTSAMDAFKRKLPSKLAPRTINHYLILIRAVLRFLWKRSRLKHVPYVPMESVPKAHVDWYTQQERDQRRDACRGCGVTKAKSPAFTGLLFSARG